jgi:predicted nucleotidyltransferase
MRIITKPIELAQSAANDYKNCYGSDLVAAIVYGSAAGSDFNPKQSDINLLIVLKRMSLDAIAKSAAIQKKWQKSRFAPPLFMDIEYIERSLDAFPVEFLNMKECHAVVNGRNILEDIVISKRDIRLQIERDLKGKWLHLVREWSLAKSDPRHLDRLLHLSLKDFSATFRAMLYLKGLPVPKDRNGLFAEIERSYGLGGRPLSAVFEAHRNSDRAAMLSAFEAYAMAIRDLSNTIDHLSTTEDA